MKETEQPRVDNAPAPERPGLRAAKRAAPWLVAAIIFYIVFREVPLEKVWHELLQLDAKEVAGLCGISAVFILGVSAIDGVAMWYGFSRFGVPLRWAEIVLVRAAMMLLAVVATPVGQAGLAAHLAGKYRIPAIPATGMVFFLFLLEIYGMVLVATVSLAAIMLFGADHVDPDAPLPLALAMVGLLWPALIIFVYVCRSEWGGGLLARFKFGSVIHPVRQLTLGEMGRVLMIKALLAAWQIGLTWPAFYIFGIGLAPLDLFAFMPLAILVSSIPITPAKLGTTQVSWVLFFGHAAPADALVAFSLLLQTLLNVARWMIGAAVLPLVYRDLLEGREKKRP